MRELNKYVGNDNPYPTGSTTEHMFVQKTLSGTKNMFNSQLRAHRVQPRLTNLLHADSILPKTICWSSINTWQMTAKQSHCYMWASFRWTLC